MKISTTTDAVIRQIAEGCIERIEALKQKEPNANINEVTLNYFIGACKCAAALGIGALHEHLKHLVITDISINGYLSVHKYATKAH